MTTWRNVKKGATIELGGKPWTVTKVKPRGKKADVRVERKGVVHEATVKLSATVKLVVGDGLDALRNNPHPLTVERERAKREERWSTPEEHDAALSLPPGVAQRNVEKILGARLIAETDDESKGWYVPPVDVTTVASHLAIFHGVTPAELGGEKKMLEAHAKAHAAADAGELFLHVLHRHTAKPS